MKRLTPVLILLLITALLPADVPLRSEELVYSILAFNGKDYSGTFSGEAGDTIYLIAERDSFVSVRKTLVYYWAITDELRTDTSSLDIPFTGTLELSSGRREPKSIGMTVYTYFNLKGDYELNWNVRTGTEALTVYQSSQAAIYGYYQAANEYERLLAQFNERANSLAVRIAEGRKTGLDVSSLVEQYESLVPPAAPVEPQTYVVPPATPQLGFRLNLPEGTYHIEFRNEDGTIMEGSRRRLVVYSRRRGPAAGIEIIPGDRWTRSVDSRTPHAVIYVDGSTDLYLRPYYQNEYNDLFYAKTARNDAGGNPEMMRWIQIQQIPSAEIVVSNRGRPITSIAEESYYIEQTSGSALGYLVVPYDPNGAHAGLDPSLKAYHIALDSGVRRLDLEVLDRTGTAVPGGGRQIRIVSPTKSGTVLMAFPLFPILAFAILRVRRSKKTSRSI